MNQVRQNIQRLPLSIKPIVISLCLLLSISVNAAFDPVYTFKKKCSSCHMIGGGDLVGPDLKGVNERRKKEWLLGFIQDAPSRINAGDPIAVELFKKYRKVQQMPEQELSKEEILSLLDFIKKGGKGFSQSVEMKSALEAKPTDITRGRLLFSGALPFSKGGPACFNCHRIGSPGLLGGGSLGPDLTQAYSNYKDKPLSKILSQFPFPLMAGVFETKPLTRKEAFQIKAFLYNVDKESPPSKEDPQKKFLLLGFLGLLVCVGGVDVFWRNRRKKSSRPTIGGNQGVGLST